MQRSDQLRLKQKWPGRRCANVFGCFEKAGQSPLPGQRRPRTNAIVWRSFAPPSLAPCERFEQREYRPLGISEYRNVSGMRHRKWRLIGLPPVGLCVLRHGLDSRNLIVDEPVGTSLTFKDRRDSADVFAVVENVQVIGRIVFASLGFPTKKLRVKIGGFFGIGGSEIGPTERAFFGRYAYTVMSLRLQDSEYGAGRILNDGHSAHIKYVEW